MPARSPNRGHGVLEHTADAVIEAWGPSAAACYEEAAAALVELFADTAAATDRCSVPLEVGPGRPEALLVMLLEELIFVVDTTGRVASSVEVEVQPDRLGGRVTTVPLAQVQVVGAVPKGVSWSNLEMARVGSGWHARATIDV